ncbi:hypothetical protein GGC65_003892 [Sphingopyxis sp. OAS728]|nr:hypothetical protein [Sphingopyxis sp. OAS728]
MPVNLTMKTGNSPCAHVFRDWGGTRLCAFHIGAA